MDDTETAKTNINIKLNDPKELTIVWDGDKATKILLDDIELPFNCEIEVKNDIITYYHDPFDMLAGHGRGPTYLQGDCEITLTIRPQRLAVRSG